ncbi:MAG: hypothetical protein ABJO36_07050 [Litorimonas sp.]
MVWSLKLVKHGIAAGLLIAFFLTGCATSQISPVSNIETADGAFSVPYRISSSGRFLIDVSVNGGSSRPLSVDTGATVSVIYSDFARSENLKVSDRTIFVRGLVGQGDRPVIESVLFGVGSKSFPLEQIVSLETPIIGDEAVGLLGSDILGNYTTLFNKETMTATFVPRRNIDAGSFAGWSHIPLQTLTDTSTNTQLYFAQTDFDGVDIPVLIDTGSNLNFINWQLAKMDTEIRKLEKKMRRNGTLQGALESTSFAAETIFYDLQLGSELWDEIDVVVMALPTLETVAPVNDPMIVAGANIFAGHTIAFDLQGRAIYIYPKPGARRAVQTNRDQILIAEEAQRRVLEDLTADPQAPF